MSPTHTMRPAGTPRTNARLGAGVSSIDAECSHSRGPQEGPFEAWPGAGIP